MRDRSRNSSTTTGGESRSRYFEDATKSFEDSLQNVSSTSGNILQAFEEIRSEIEGENSYMRNRISCVASQNDTSRDQIQFLVTQKRELEAKEAVLRIKFNEMMIAMELFEGHRDDICQTADILNQGLGQARDLKLFQEGGVSI
mmetsp:Transcript_11111/g.13163  ORF Transcript_11111/g.13163 Transcript_11111/m.13163 type:complete len:144 (+) Transcript_11111:204-635(+)|eukprot:CAMPEP_0198264854 /NCGR_PEP_ID=MMETSP1447-20131203/18109_1 /TAXON_ID=420782 /ORGANISM="Chaetoceros dichaeta, Strain CCMP1751" /LENGTH=143 /DNA_ID=CAMNT_0043953983 /DNA_START=69 /DNA_END=500 /DNA_ORIENTATION=+